MQANCAELSEIYDENNMRDYAVEEWFGYYQTPADVFPRSRVSGILDCFCKAEKKKLGMSVATTLYKDNEKREAYACYEWFTDIYTTKAYNQSISVMINIINTVLKLILVKLISSIGEDTKSAINRSIKVGVFVTQFFNTGFLLLLSSANLT